MVLMYDYKSPKTAGNRAAASRRRDALQPRTLSPSLPAAVTRETGEKVGGSGRLSWGRRRKPAPGRVRGRHRPWAGPLGLPGAAASPQRRSQRPPEAARARPRGDAAGLGRPAGGGGAAELPDPAGSPPAAPGAPPRPSASAGSREELPVRALREGASPADGPRPAPARIRLPQQRGGAGSSVRAQPAVAFEPGALSSADRRRAAPGPGSPACSGNPFPPARPATPTSASPTGIFLGRRRCGPAASSRSPPPGQLRSPWRRSERRSGSCRPTCPQAAFRAK